MHSKGPNGNDALDGVHEASNPCRSYRLGAASECEWGKQKR